MIRPLSKHPGKQRLVHIRSSFLRFIYRTRIRKKLQAGILHENRLDELDGFYRQRVWDKTPQRKIYTR